MEVLVPDTILGQRTLLSGKIVSNFGQSTIDCVVRSLSDVGACLQVESTREVPQQFQLVMQAGRERKPCRVQWQSDDRIGVTFAEVDAGDVRAESGQDLVRAQMLALRASLDEIDVGVVLLDAELRAQFINKAFRRMWKLPDAKADAKVPFVALMYHGRDTRAYELAEDDLDGYVAARVERVQAGDPVPLDLRLSSGQVLRFQCAVLPNGGRLLTYTHVTDIVRHADRLQALSEALHSVEDGVMLFDGDLRLEFINGKARRLWSVPEDAQGMTLREVIAHTHLVFDAPPDDIDRLVKDRLARIRDGDPAPHDIRTIDGKTIRAHCTKLQNGRRMLTYCDVTDLVSNAERLELLSTIDPMTGAFNRRHFLGVAETEWSRFQRYHRPLSLVMLDIDHFKSVNDRYGHATGDEVICAVASACSDGQRASDVAGRLGGEEFAILLPETDAGSARLVAERIRARIAAELFAYEKVNFRVTVSIGVTTATLAMSGIAALMRSADMALYEAKSLGRNRVVLFRQSQPADLRNAAE
jgi:diguanylate cyclase (GGDEF)-like protein